jgi:hypothetical protein
MSGWLTFEEAEAQVEAASDKYKYAENPAEEEYLLQERFDLASDFYNNYVEITDNDMTQLTTTSAYNSNGDYIGEVYSGLNIINPGPETGAKTIVADRVINSLENDYLYGNGGHVPGSGIGFDTNGWTGFCDPLLLAEASKITGVKWF